MSPRDAINLLDQVGANFEGKRQDHINILQAVMTLRVFIDEHDPLDPKDNGASTLANENPAKKTQKLQKK